MAKSSTSFKKGQSGNPAGRPKKYREYEIILEKVMDAKEANDLTAFENILIVLKDEALKGNTDACKYFTDRFLGRPRQALDISDDREDKTAEALNELMNEIKQKTD